MATLKKEGTRASNKNDNILPGFGSMPIKEAIKSDAQKSFDLDNPMPERYDLQNDSI